MKKFRTEEEQMVGKSIAKIFDQCEDSTETKLENFPKYVRRNNLKRFLAHYEIFKRVLNVKGSIVECGVFKGFGFMTWAKLSTMLEPENFTRRVYGFDTFEGFPDFSDKDKNKLANPKTNALRADSFQELQNLIKEYDNDRYLGHMDKAHLVPGNASHTIPKFIEENPHLIVSLLFLDFDLYEPTKVAIENFVPRMPKGSVIAFDELDNPQWPGEALALVESLGVGKLRIERLPWDPYIGFAVID